MVDPLRGHWDRRRQYWAQRDREETMPKVSDVYGGQYLKAAMIGEDSYNMEIKGVYEEEIGQEKDRKLVAYFKQTDKGLVLNATNANTLAEEYGDDTDKWAGKVVRLFTTWTEFGGKRVKGLRVEAVRAGSKPAIPKQAEPEVVYEDDLSEFEPDNLTPGDDLPF